MTQAQALDIFSYEPTTGILRWKHDRGTIGKSGNVVGNLSHKGYLQTRVTINGVRLSFKVHRLIWFYVHGYHPDQIDHINHIRDDNRLVNLRDSTPSQNSQNRTISKANKTGCTGVYPTTSGKGYYAEISIKGKRVYYESFNTLEEAKIARGIAKIKYGFHPNSGLPK